MLLFQNKANFFTIFILVNSNVHLSFGSIFGLTFFSFIGFAFFKFHLSSRLVYLIYPLLSHFQKEWLFHFPICWLPIGIVARVSELLERPESPWTADSRSGQHHPKEFHQQRQGATGDYGQRVSQRLHQFQREQCQGWEHQECKRWGNRVFVVGSSKRILTCWVCVDTDSEWKGP